MLRTYRNRRGSHSSPTRNKLAFDALQSLAHFIDFGGIVLNSLPQMIPILADPMARFAQAPSKEAYAPRVVSVGFATDPTFSSRPQRSGEVA